MASRKQADQSPATLAVLDLLLPIADRLAERVATRVAADLVERLGAATERPAAIGPLMDAEATAHYLSLSKSTVYKYVETGRLPHVKLDGGQLRFTKADLDEWIERQKLGGTTAVELSRKIRG